MRHRSVRTPPLVFFHKTKKLVEFVRIDIHHISEVNDILNAIPLAKLSFVSGS